MWHEVYAATGMAELESWLVAAVHGKGFLDGDGETPHQLTLRACPRAGVASYVTDAMPRDLVAAFHDGRQPRVGYRRKDCLQEWRNGQECIRLMHATNGSYEGRAWIDLLEEPKLPLPAELLALLRNYRTAEFAARLLDHLYGLPVPTGLARVFHYPYQRVTDPLLLHFFDLVMNLAEHLGEIEIPTFATVHSWRDGEHSCLRAMPAEPLRQWASGAELELDLQPMAARLQGYDLAAVEQHLCAALAGLAVGRDLLFGAGLAMHLRESPRFETTNPLTGQPIITPGKKRPVFVFAARKAR